MSKPTIHTLDLRFLGHQETIAAFLIVTRNELALVETGPYSTFGALEEALWRHGYKVENVKKVFLTHIHFDHAGAAWALAQRGATIYVHPFGEKHMIDPSKLYNSARQIYKDQMDYLWGAMEGIDPSRIHATQHGEKIPIGDGEMIAWHTPGHAVHHIAWQLGDDLFCGDVAGVKIGDGIVVPPCPPPDINVEDWLESLERIRNLGVKRLHLTHFGQVTRIKAHLKSLGNRLVRWSNWMKPRYEKGLKPEEVTPQYMEMVHKELRRFGITGEALAQYESANPSWMSVAGLLRYWHKKLGA